LPLSLKSIRIVLKGAFDLIQEDKMQDILLAMGNTGSGKSTLLSAMVFGTEALCLKTIKEQTVVKRGGKEIIKDK